jgi:hypothetical protein
MITKAQITKAMNLTAGEMSIALYDSGYDEKVDTAEFLGLTDEFSNFAYVCKFTDEDGLTDECFIYVSYTAAGFLNAEY